jgi:excisionase family DNA binding protein
MGQNCYVAKIATPADDQFTTTVEVARLLGMAVRSVQQMVDRGQLEAWRTPGGHRRILRESVERLLASRGIESSIRPNAAKAKSTDRRQPGKRAVKHPAQRRLGILYIEDSAHFQNLVSLLVKRTLPDADLHLASDGIVGLAMAGELVPDVMIVDILLPGIDGATLISRLREHKPLSQTQLVVLTSLKQGEREKYAMALEGLPVIHKASLMEELPALLKRLQSKRPQVAAGR